MADSGLPWMMLSYFGLAVASAVMPWLNAEVIVLSLPAVAPSRTALALLVVIATVGQMTGKGLVYWAGRKGNKVLPGRAGMALEKMKDRLAARPSKATALVLVSSLVGLPPFFLVTFVAGGLVRFGALVMVPQLMVMWFKG